MNTKKTFKDRREHTRLPIIHGVLEPVDLSFEDAKTGAVSVQPGILSDMSAGGMRLLTFAEPPKTKNLDMVINLPGVGSVPIEGRVSWIRGKGGVYISGIAFTKISKENIHKINLMAEDFEDCETRVALHLPEACVENCKCHCVCNKPQKDDTLFKPCH